MSASAACYHLPGLFEFYDFYRVFLPLFRQHREYFYDWCCHRLPVWRTGGLHLGRRPGRVRGPGPPGGAGPDPGIRHLRPADLQQLPAAAGAPVGPPLQPAVPPAGGKPRSAERSHRPLGPAAGPSAPDLSRAVFRLLHHQGADGFFPAAPGAGAAGVPLCGGGFPAEPGLPPAGHPAPGPAGQDGASVQRVLRLRAAGTGPPATGPSAGRTWAWRVPSTAAPPRTPPGAIASPGPWRTPASSA